MRFPSNWLTVALRLFWIKSFCILPSHWLVRKKELFIALPYLGNLSLAITIRLQNSINKNLSFCKIEVIFKSTARLSKFFRFENKMTFNLRSNVVYKFFSGRRNATYNGKPCQHLNIRVGEHWGISLLTGKSWRLKQLLLLKIICSFAIMYFSSRTSKFWQVVIQNFTLRSKKVF